MANRCNVLLFAQAADAVGTPQVAFDLPSDATVADALNEMCRQYPALAPLRRHVAVAVNERYAKAGDVIPAEATIAIIPPVSGG